MPTIEEQLAAIAARPKSAVLLAEELATLEQLLAQRVAELVRAAGEEKARLEAQIRILEERIRVLEGGVTPVPVPPPPAPENLIWSDPFLTRPEEKFGRYILESPDDAKSFTVADGILKVVFVAGTPECYRSEISIWGTDPSSKTAMRYPTRKVMWWGFGIRIPETHVLADAKSVLFQWYQTLKMNPPLSLELRGGNLKLVRLWSEAPVTDNPGETREDIWVMPIEKGKWYQLVMRSLFDNRPVSKGGQGSLRWWVNGTQQSMAHADPFPNCYGGTDQIKPSFGCYRPGARPDSSGNVSVPNGNSTEIHFSHLKIGGETARIADMGP
jgi:hypothetical protein